MPKATRRRIFKGLLKGLALVVLATVIYYGQARLLKEKRAVRIIEIADPVEVAAPTGLRVACYNIAHARGPGIDGDNWNGEARERARAHLSAIATQIRESQSSLVVLNEVDFDAAWSDGIDQAGIIAREAGFPFLVKQRNFDVTLPFFTLQFGNAILSRYPVTGARLLKFPALSAKEDIFAGNHDGVLATIAAPGGPLRVVAVHLEYRDEATRVGAAGVIAKLVAQDPEIPLIALGDFNTAPVGCPGHQIDQDGANAISLLQSEAGMKTIVPDDLKNSPHFTYPPTRPERIIDWIFVSSGLKLRERHTIASELSDHRMVVGLISRDR